MKNKLYLKIVLIIIIFFTALNTFTIQSNAIDSIIGDADSFLEKGDNETLNFGQVKIVSDSLYNLFFIVGVAATVLVGMVIGIKFMMESAEEKAKIKEALVPYLIGCVIIYGAFGIWKLAINISKNLTTEVKITERADPEETDDIESKLDSGEIEISDIPKLSDKQLHAQYSRRRLSEALKNKVYGVSAAGAPPPSSTPKMTYEQAAKEAWGENSVNYAIWEACLKNGLLTSDMHEKPIN